MSANYEIYLIRGEVKDEIKSVRYNPQTRKWDVTFSNNAVYSYAYDNVEKASYFKSISPDEIKIVNSQGKTLNNIKYIDCYKSKSYLLYRISFSNGSVRIYKDTDITVSKNIASTSIAKNLLQYYQYIAKEVGLKATDGSNILANVFEKIFFIDDGTVLSKYIVGKYNKPKSIKQDWTTLFPFGCNLSQMRAVENALLNQISIIEGPPGTGKTQTILNIIANVVAYGGTVAVVSNNNSATENVYEKLQKYGYGFIAAQLGNSDNKKEFISYKQKEYPDFLIYKLTPDLEYRTQNEVCQLEKELKDMLTNKNRIAELKSELLDLRTQKTHFESFYSETYNSDLYKPYQKYFNSSSVLDMWLDIQMLSETNRKMGFAFKLRMILHYHIVKFSLFKKPTEELLAVFKMLYYILREKEIEDEISLLEKLLDTYKFDDKSAELSVKSEQLFKTALAEKYGCNSVRQTFKDEDLWRNPETVNREYPVILSTTHSIRSSLKDTVYDYVIVDESSQVDLATGFLTMSCAKNIVVVGDLNQLPNVITENDRQAISTISETSQVDQKYRYEDNSLLSSVISVFPEAPRTLLREHYRCHPKIIGFCNKKFYGGQLIVMTEDHDENDVLKAHITPLGNHARGHYNQRQIDIIRDEIIPDLKSNDMGIIAPYNAQTSALAKDLSCKIDISTVHKFQGREKDDIIITTVDNEITEFTDNPNMLNVAVSRAKNRLRLVMSDSEKNEKTNVGDLLKYIQYSNFEVVKSEVYSVFDLLYKAYDQKRLEYLKAHKRVSEYDSENLMYSVIEDVLKDERFMKLDVVCHQSLNSIIRDLHRLEDDEVRYVMNDNTHIDFLIYGKLDKMLVLAVEVDGFDFHKEGTRQHERDEMKDEILQKYNIPLIRFGTTGSNEKKRLEERLIELVY